MMLKDISFLYITVIGFACTKVVDKDLFLFRVYPVNNTVKIRLLGIKKIVLQQILQDDCIIYIRIINSVKSDLPIPKTILLLHLLNAELIFLHTFYDKNSAN